MDILPRGKYFYLDDAQKGGIISGLPQRTILGPILYNLFLMTSFISFYWQLPIILQMTTLLLALVKQFKN